MVINAEVEANKNTRTTKSAIQTAGESNNTRSFIGIIGVKPSIKNSGLGGIFKYEENKSMVTEEM